MEYIFAYLKGGIRSRHLLGLIGAACIGFLGIALLLQHFKDVLPCPLCVLQRSALLVAAQFAQVQSWRDLAGLERVTGGLLQVQRAI